MRYIILFVTFCSCSFHQVDEHNKSYHHIDSAMVNSQKIHDSAIVLHKLVDDKTNKEVEKVLGKVQSLRLENLNLKTEIKELNQTTKAVHYITIHDTVLITEKKNFWGKTKRDSMSSSSTDTLELIEN